MPQKHVFAVLTDNPPDAYVLTEIICEMGVAAIVPNVYSVLKKSARGGATEKQFLTASLYQHVAKKRLDSLSLQLAAELDPFFDPPGEKAALIFNLLFCAGLSGCTECVKILLVAWKKKEGDAFPGEFYCQDNRRLLFFPHLQPLRDDPFAASYYTFLTRLIRFGLSDILFLLLKAGFGKHLYELLITEACLYQKEDCIWALLDLSADVRMTCCFLRIAFYGTFLSMKCVWF